MIREQILLVICTSGSTFRGHIGQFVSCNLLIRMYFRSKYSKGVTQDCLCVLDLILDDFLAYTLVIVLMTRYTTNFIITPAGNATTPEAHIARRQLA